MSVSDAGVGLLNCLDPIAGCKAPAVAAPSILKTTALMVYVSITFDSTLIISNMYNKCNSQHCTSLGSVRMPYPPILRWYSASRIASSLSRIMQSAHLLGLTRIALYLGGDISLIQVFDLHPIELSEWVCPVYTGLTNMLVSCTEETHLWQTVLKTGRHRYKMVTRRMMAPINKLGQTVTI